MCLSHSNSLLLGAITFVVTEQLVSFWFKFPKPLLRNDGAKVLCQGATKIMDLNLTVYRKGHYEGGGRERESARAERTSEAVGWSTVSVHGPSGVPWASTRHGPAAVERLRLASKPCALTRRLLAHRLVAPGGRNPLVLRVEGSDNCLRKQRKVKLVRRIRKESRNTK